MRPSIPLYLLAFVFCGPALAVTLPKSPINFESDLLEYDEFGQVIIASGNVTVRQSSYTFRSNQAIFNIPQKEVEARGAVRFKDQQGDEIRSQYLRYNTEFGSAQLLDAEGAFGPWLFAAKKIERDEAGNFLLERARLSTCEIDLSKYHLFGYRIKVLPKKRLTVQHALFRIGPVPVLYLPYYYYSLGEKHLAFQIFPGQNQSEGAFVRTIWGYPPTDDTYVKAYLDYLSKRGIGTGGEFNYYRDGRLKGSFYGYQIDDRLTGERRWNARLSHWQRLTSDAILQGNMNRLSDENFPNDFFREDYNRVVPDPESTLAATYQKKNVYLRLIGQRQELFNKAEENYLVRQALVPEVEAIQVQTPTGIWGIEETASASFLNRFAGFSAQAGELDRDYRRESEAQVSLIRNFPLVPKTSLTQKLILKNQWIDKPQGNEPEERFVQRIEPQTTLRQIFGRILDVELTYFLSQRLQANQGHDQGRELHNLTFFTWLRPDPYSLRFDTGFDLPRAKGEPLAFLERKNYRPLRAEVSSTVSKKMEVFFREEYTLSDPNTESAHFLNTQSEISWGRKALGEDYLSAGTSYTSDRDDEFELRNSARYTFSELLRLEGTIRTLLTYRNGHLFEVERADFVEKEILTKTQWRCWNLSFVFRERKGVLEFLFNIELELERSNRKKETNPTHDQEWYPWRGMG